MGDLGFNASEQEIDDLYYDAMELLNEGKIGARKAEKLLMKALILDNKNVQTYVGLAHVYGALKDERLARQNIKWAYEETAKVFPKWPKRMAWSCMDNRRYLRAIHYRAELYADEGSMDIAEKLFRLLLELNPGDNQGIRYMLAGLFAGISPAQINGLFDVCDAKQNWDELENLVSNQNKIHKFWPEIKS